MTPSPAAIATARIEGFLSALNGAGRPPTRGELYWLREALQKLEAGLYPEGEDAMLKAERTNSTSQGTAPAITASEAIPVDELRAELRRILQ
jgi:hypothetical protein